VQSNLGSGSGSSSSTRLQTTKQSKDTKKKAKAEKAIKEGEGKEDKALEKLAGAVAPMAQMLSEQLAAPSAAPPAP
jgi:hypothetical protein